MPYRLLFMGLIFVEAVSKLSLVWTVSNIFNALTAIPNLVSLLVLSGVVASYTRDYRERLRRGQPRN